MKFSKMISQDMELKEKHVVAVIELLEEGATIWFIARYRKEKTGSLDEVKITDIRDRLEICKKLEDRRGAILKSLAERELLNPSLESSVKEASTLAGLEDLYEAFRPKRLTRASKAHEKGLGPLADFIFAQRQGNLDKEIQAVINPEKGVVDADDALAGAMDIIAENLSLDPDLRKSLRQLFLSKAIIRSRVKKSKKEEAGKFKDYFEWEELAFKAPSHRVHAMFRGLNEGMLTVHVLPDEKTALNLMGRHFLAHPSQSGSAIREQMDIAVRDAYKRLLSKSMEKESIALLKKAADTKAIEVFAQNLRELLLSPPLGEKKILAIDPGFRTGCKVACLNAQGKLMAHDLIYVHQPEHAKKTLEKLIHTHGIQAMAIGNGTAGRETQTLVNEILSASGLEKDVDVVLTDESGASVYSASDIAREEFPDHDITVRGAVSIGRRLMDPLAELVKIDPKAIGVGQYQHDVDQTLLRSALDNVVKSCVNQVGVDANTASKELLAQVSGLNKTIAANLVVFRNEKGPFLNRKQLLKVPRLGPKAFEQAAGFLRIQNGDNPLDKSGIHPESYGLIKAMARDKGWDIARDMGRKDLGRDINLSDYVTSDAGLPTLKDIIKELASPGRDPRQSFQTFSFDSGVEKITDLVPGMSLPGIITNVTAFGAFVDVGAHQDGLVHISQLADRFVNDPNEVVKVRQQVNVRVLEVDVSRKRISLSMKSN